MNRIADLCLLAMLTLAAPLAAQTGAGAPWDSVARILGAAPAVNAGTYRYNFPRSDITVQVKDVTLLPGFALVSWVGFGVIGGDTVAMGDIVTTDAEFQPVLEQLHSVGGKVGAIHNHLVSESPRIMYIHYMVSGSAVELATKMKSVLAKTRAPMPVAPVAAAAVTIDTSRVFTMLGAKGRASGALAQLSFNFVPEGVTVAGKAVPAPLSTASPINIQRVASDRVIATGDFTIKAQQLHDVIDVLSANHITPTAAHSHMVGETPTLYYVHFWADGTYDTVLRGLRAAVDAAGR